MAIRDNMSPAGGRELKSDDTILDVAAWREAVQTAIEAVQTAVEAVLTVTGGLTDAELRASDVPVTLDGEAVDATIAPPTTIVSGVKTVASAGTDEVLAASQALTVGVRVKAYLTNTGIVYVGPEGVAAATGYRLNAGEEVFLPVDNLADVWLDTSVNGSGVSYVGS